MDLVTQFYKNITTEYITNKCLMYLYKKKKKGSVTK